MDILAEILDMGKMERYTININGTMLSSSVLVAQESYVMYDRDDYGGRFRFSSEPPSVDMQARGCAAVPPRYHPANGSFERMIGAVSRQREGTFHTGFCFRWQRRALLVHQVGQSGMYRIAQWKTPWLV